MRANTVLSASSYDWHNIIEIPMLFVSYHLSIHFLYLPLISTPLEDSYKLARERTTRRRSQ